jgi:hypothetical protein
MMTYRVVECEMDGQDAWGVERTAPGEPPEVVQHFLEREFAEAESDRLNAIEQKPEA